MNKLKQTGGWWKNGGLALLSILIFAGILEGIGVLLRIEPLALSQDSMMRYASSTPLFIPSPSDPKKMTTAPNKLKPFNIQTFLKKKPKGTKRIFCLGGSTTYGRPYNDKASFCNWLRQMLPVADPTADWELINAGGISYASYRIAELMKELVKYEPDLFILYSGHNEFLEQRTYAHIAKLPFIVRQSAWILEHTRGYSLLKRVYMSIRNSKAPDNEIHTMQADVTAILDNSYGPKFYSRDDTLSRNIITHYKQSVSRIINKAKYANANILVISTPSNLLHCSPFKSQYSSSLNQAQKLKLDSLLNVGKKHFNKGMYPLSLKIFKAAHNIDKRHAEVLYFLGKSYFETGEPQLAYTYLQKAKDEDICPLRAFSDEPRWLEHIANEEKVPFLDFNSILEEQSMEKTGHRLLGKSDFYDHVHLTIENHKLLAIKIIDKMAKYQLLQTSPHWKKNIQGISKDVMASLDKRAYGFAMHNLAKVLNWAGKHEDAVLAAESALAVVDDDIQALGSALYIGTSYQRKKMLDSAIYYYQLAFRLDSNNFEANDFLGKAYFLKQSFSEAEPFLERALRLSGNNSQDLLAKLGQLNIFLKRPEKALAFFERRANLSPHNPKAQCDFGYALLHAYQINRAELIFSRIMQASPNYPDAMAGIGEVLMVKNQPTEAIKYFSRAMEADPTNLRYQNLIQRLLNYEKPN